MQNLVAVAALSDTGCVRTNNEDSFGYDAQRQVYVVCDGMGGLASGEVASQTAVATFLQSIAASDPALAPERMLGAAIVAANDAVYLASSALAHGSMGTTLVAGCVRHGTLYVANVGDSRAYLMQGQCTQVTVDHSYVNELVRSGAVSIEDAPKLNLKAMSSVITRALGVQDTVQPDFFSADLDPHSVVLLTSDGLTRYVEGRELGQMLAAGDLAACAQKLVALARERGGGDNITVLLLQMLEA